MIINISVVVLFAAFILDARSSMVLGAGSAIAGNLCILGTASIVINIQNAEKRGGALDFLNLPESEFPWAFSIY